MLQKIKKRITNAKVIVALASGILLILVNLGVISVGQSDSILTIVNTVLGALIALGVVGNPESHVNE